MKLYHISENGNIDQFIPKISKEQWGFKKYVWAINEEKIHNYILHRECPRICLDWKERKIISDWIDPKEFRAYIFVSLDWLERIKSCTLFKYQFSPSNFTEIDSIAGYYVSSEVEIPIGVEEINDCLKTLNSLNIGIKFLDKPHLKQLREVVIQSATKFSIIKWANLEEVN